MSGRRRQRSRFQIICDVLMACNGKPLLPSVICRRANLGDYLFKEVTAWLVLCGFLSEKRFGDRKVYYVTSAAGLEFVRRFRDLQEYARPLEGFLGCF